MRGYMRHSLWLATIVITITFPLYSSAQSYFSDPSASSVEARITGVLSPTTHSTDEISAQLVQADPLVQAREARERYGYTGSGYSVAIIDTGVDYNHPALGGGFGTGHRVIAGYDFVNNDSNPMDDNGHGTHVAGIAAGNDSTYKGIAPDANIIALKVLGADGSGSFSYVESALQWVIANRSTYNIVSINMSLGAGNYSSNPFSFLEDEFTALRASGVSICVATGNSFYTYSSVLGRAYPASSPLVISVGAYWDSNSGGYSWGSGAVDYSTNSYRITSFSQRDSGVSIFTPGAMLTAAYLGNTFGTLAGTSMASPIMAGAVVLLHQALVDKGRSDLATPPRILQFFTDNAYTVNDGDDENDNVINSGLNFKTLKILNALDEVASLAATATPTSTPTSPGPTSTSTPSFTATSVPTTTPTSTPSATATPTSVPSQPSPTSTPEPINTQPSTPTPEPTETQSPSPTESPTEIPLDPPSQDETITLALNEINSSAQQISGSFDGTDSPAIQGLEEALNELSLIMEESSLNRSEQRKLFKVIQSGEKLTGIASKTSKSRIKRRLLYRSFLSAKRDLLKALNTAFTEFS